MSTICRIILLQNDLYHCFFLATKRVFFALQHSFETAVLNTETVANQAFYLLYN